MITEEIKAAFQKVDPVHGILEFPILREPWIVLFNYYNSKNQKKIGTGCRPCFPKVYYFIKQEIAKSLADK